MRRKGTTLKFRMELRTNKERMFGNFYNLHEFAIRRGAGNHKTGFLQYLAVRIIYFKAMAMALGNQLFAICLIRARLPV